MAQVTITLTGTGTPIPRPHRAGAGVLIEHGDLALQFDAGRATVMRLAEAGLACQDLDALFLTHHHADHVTALPDLLISRWIEGARQELPVIAPAGPLDSFGRDVLDLYAEDISVRRHHTGRPPVPLPDWRSFEPASTPEVVWTDDGVQVLSVTVRHEPVRPAVAYRVDVDGRQVVVSGDTRVCEEVEHLAHEADVLVHEAVRVDAVGDGRGYIAKYHAETVALGEMAARADVRRLVLTHLEPAPMTDEDEQAFLEDIRRGGFRGDLFVGRDLLQVRL